MSDTKRTLTLAVFIDAMGWEVIKDRPFLDGVAPHRKRINTIFGYSCTAIPTILTGVTPAEHRHFSFFFHSSRSPFGALKPLGLIPEFIAGRGRVRSRISGLVRRAYGFTGYFQLYNMPFEQLHHFDYCEKQDLYKVGGLAPHETLFDVLEREAVPHHVSDWRRSETANVGETGAVVDRGEVELAYLYTADMDGLLHVRGKSHGDVDAKLAWYDGKIRDLLQRARRRYDDVRLVVFSDHGMNDVTSTVDLMGPVAATGLRFGEDYVAVFDSTMARFWFKNDRAREVLTALLDGTKGGRRVNEAELRSWGTWFDDAQYGEELFLMDDGVLIVPSHMGKKPLAGMHGYHPFNPDAYASMVSTHPIPDEVVGLTDVKPFLLSTIGRRPEGWTVDAVRPAPCGEVAP